MSAFVDRIAKKLNAEIERVCKMAVLEIDKELRRSTPVDTGHARANWIPSVGQPHRGEVEGMGTHAQGVAQVLAFKLGSGTLYVTNNVPYIRRLNEGSSKQAPSLFVEAAVDRAIQTVRRKTGANVSRSEFQSAVGAEGAANLASAYLPFD